ncbi:MAG: hypothetical protein JO139_03850, partial [Alphaproteobacteria bacterium]|nr:hypothetical protein [Alphaproteobacteria bacterium]
AIRLAKQAAKIPAGTAVKLTVFPRQKEPLELIYDRLTGKDTDEGTAASGAIERSLKTVGPLMQRLDALFDSPVLLMMPEIAAPR